ncbi:MAG: AAA family ATPase [Patescibacteria group bacterium]
MSGAPPLVRNITISGLPGSGSTTLLDQLREHPDLKFEGWSGFSGGAFMRNYAMEKGLMDKDGKLHHSADIYSDDFDREVDMGMREKLSTEQHWIIESWLSGFLAQQVPGVFKILLKCSNTAVKVDRIVNRDDVTAEVALANMNKRYKSNVAKWRRMYAKEWQTWIVETGTMKATDPIDFWHPSLYDIVIDTYSTNQKETVEQVIHAIENHLAD